jgi:hypothetical protein
MLLATCTVVNQHATATVIAESDLSIGTLKEEAKKRAIEKLNERNLAVQREVNEAFSSNEALSEFL